ncbi:hypothetical protein G9A89_010017 [Geosiphon pyriformis]|nr:hypothetical protein G9A89_010017 [Geosiphon pyriformis]
MKYIMSSKDHKSQKQQISSSLPAIELFDDDFDFSGEDSNNNENKNNNENSDYFFTRQILKLGASLRPELGGNIFKSNVAGSPTAIDDFAMFIGPEVGWDQQAFSNSSYASSSTTYDKSFESEQEDFDDVIFPDSTSDSSFSLTSCYQRSSIFRATSEYDSEEFWSGLDPQEVESIFSVKKIHQNSNITPCYETDDKLFEQSFSGMSKPQPNLPRINVKSPGIVQPKTTISFSQLLKSTNDTFSNSDKAKSSKSLLSPSESQKKFSTSKISLSKFHKKPNIIKNDAFNAFHPSQTSRKDSQLGKISPTKSSKGSANLTKSSSQGPSVRNSIEPNYPERGKFNKTTEIIKTNNTLKLERKSIGLNSKLNFLDTSSLRIPSSKKLNLKEDERKTDELKDFSFLGHRKHSKNIFSHRNSKSLSSATSSNTGNPENLPLIRENVEENSLSLESFVQDRSPSSKWKWRRKPTLIRNLNSSKRPKVIGEMTYNPDFQRWDGNESILKEFEFDKNYSQFRIQRPALISNTQSMKSTHIIGNMIFDSEKMCWKCNAKDSLDDDILKNFDDNEHDDWDFRKDIVFERQNSTGSSQDFEVGCEFDVTPAFLSSLMTAERQHGNEMSRWYPAAGSLRNEQRFGLRDPNIQRGYLYDIRMASSNRRNKPNRYNVTPRDGRSKK